MCHINDELMTQEDEGGCGLNYYIIRMSSLHGINVKLNDLIIPVLAFC
jgi:hypothetical protein